MVAVASFETVFMKLPSRDLMDDAQHRMFSFSRRRVNRQNPHRSSRCLMVAGLAAGRHRRAYHAMRGAMKYPPGSGAISGQSVAGG